MPLSLADLLVEASLPFEKDVPMAERTTLRVGGPAAYWLDARGADDIACAMRAAQQAGTPCLIVGLGSNLLVRDGGIDGLVVHIGARMAGVEINGRCITAQAGIRLSQLAVAAQAAGLSGLEAVSGIPGTLGGAVYMNAGSYGVEIGSLVTQVEVIDVEGHTSRLSGSEMAFGYRKSALMADGGIATGVTLRLAKADPVAIQDEMRRYARQRREKQPLTLPSAGSFFKRPNGRFAGELIEQAGLKGLAIGGAQVSTMHAGFLVNTGGATAQDFLTLMNRVTERVYAESGVTLEPEVRILGCDSSC